MSKMELYLSKNHSDEEHSAEKGVYGLVFSSKEDVIKLCEFFEKVKEHLKDNDKCHMHFRDSFEEWNKDDHFDIEVNTII